MNESAKDFIGRLAGIVASVKENLAKDTDVVLIVRNEREDNQIFVGSIDTKQLAAFLRNAADCVDQDIGQNGMVMVMPSAGEA